MPNELTEQDLLRIKNSMINGELSLESQARAQEKFVASEKAFLPMVEKLFRSRQFTAEDLAFRIIPQRP